MLKSGDVLDDKYEILKQIGKGGTSLVYLAMNQRLNQQWVIKEIDNTQSSIDMDRVLKEARMMMSFDHPAIPRIVDIINKGTFTYIVMDYVSGQSLAYELKHNGPQPQEVVVDWAKQLCNVLVYLHSLETPIIYHDLKPGNIILKEPERNLKLIDFGEARPCINGNAPGGGKTREYAAPEQQRETRGNTDQRTDIYCFGTTIYRLLTGKFPPMSPEQVGSIRETFPDLNISKGMDNIIKKCTQTDPNKRFQSASDLMNALENIELWDEDYIKKLNRRIRSVVICLVMSILMLAVGIGFRQAKVFVNTQDYENLVGTAQSVDYETKVANYESAIRIDGTNPEAYIKLLEAYEDNNRFGNVESQQFSTLYNTNKSEFDMQSEEVLEMHFLIGRIYFNMYSDENNSFRSRILKSLSFFEYINEYGTEAYENYNISSSYYTLCTFFKTYVLNDNSINEPTEEVYREMLMALKSCLIDMESYSAEDAAHTRLDLYGYILDMLNANIRGFVLKNITQEELVEILNLIKDAANGESVTQEENINLQESILLKNANVLDNVQREYESMKRGQ